MRRADSLRGFVGIPNRHELWVIQAEDTNSEGIYE